MQSAENPTYISQIFFLKVKSLYQISLLQSVSQEMFFKKFNTKKKKITTMFYHIYSFSVTTFEHLERAIKPQDVSSLHRVHLNSIQLHQIVFGNNTYNSILLSNPPAKVLIFLTQDVDGVSTFEGQLVWVVP